VTTVRVSGTEGYAEEAEKLIRQWERLSFLESHQPVLHLIPTVGSRVPDIGAGAGNDAASLAALGHRVVAVEPINELRMHGIAIRASLQIEWINDSLPDLVILLARKEVFDLVMLTAVWMHLDGRQQRRAMPNVASLMRPGGTLIITLRHGPKPRGRRMFEVSAQERSNSRGNRLCSLF
jgi:protein-L-isoaspartate O-methyltransferase